MYTVILTAVCVAVIVLILGALLLCFLPKNRQKPKKELPKQRPEKHDPHESEELNPSNVSTIPMPLDDPDEKTRSEQKRFLLSELPSRKNESRFNLELRNPNQTEIKRPHELQISAPSINVTELKSYNHIAGSMLGLAIGDALGAHVEFRPHDYLLDHPVTDLSSGGTWGLEKGQFTDDTSMALCLAASLLDQHGFNLYDQLVRYKWWYRHGYMSSTGECFDIGAATRQSIEEFERRQKEFANKYNLLPEQMNSIDDPELLRNFNVYCSRDGVAGNGALMRLAPVPLFFNHHPPAAVDYSGQSARITHGDQKAVDACRYYGALIVAALQGASKDDLLANNFYEQHRLWFGNKELHPDILAVAHGSYKKPDGYDEGIRGSGYVVKALEAALWAFWSDGDSFERGALLAVNLGDDTDTTAAIYGQLAGAYYGLDGLPKRWLKDMYAREFLLTMSEWLAYEGEAWKLKNFQKSSDV